MGVLRDRDRRGQIGSAGSRQTQASRTTEGLPLTRLTCRVAFLARGADDVHQPVEHVLRGLNCGQRRHISREQVRQYVEVEAVAPVVDSAERPTARQALEEPTGQQPQKLRKPPQLHPRLSIRHDRSCRAVSSRRSGALVIASRNAPTRATLPANCPGSTALGGTT